MEYVFRCGSKWHFFRASLAKKAKDNYLSIRNRYQSNQSFY